MAGVQIYLAYLQGAIRVIPAPHPRQTIGLSVLCPFVVQLKLQRKLQLLRD